MAAMRDRKGRFLKGWDGMTPADGHRGYAKAAKKKRDAVNTVNAPIGAKASFTSGTVLSPAEAKNFRVNAKTKDLQPDGRVRIGGAKATKSRDGVERGERNTAETQLKLSKAQQERVRERQEAPARIRAAKLKKAGSNPAPQPASKMDQVAQNLNMKDPRTMTPTEKIEAVELMHGTGSKQHLQALSKWDVGFKALANMSGGPEGAFKIRQDVARANAEAKAYNEAQAAKPKTPAQIRALEKKLENARVSLARAHDARVMKKSDNRVRSMAEVKAQAKVEQLQNELSRAKTNSGESGITGPAPLASAPKVGKADEKGWRPVTENGQVVGYIKKEDRSAPIMNGRIQVGREKPKGMTAKAIDGKETWTSSSRVGDAVEVLQRDLKKRNVDVSAVHRENEKREALRKANREAALARKAEKEKEKLLASKGGASLYDPRK